VTPQERVAGHFRWQAEGCRALGSVLYATLLEKAADDLLGGGPVADVLAGQLDHRRRDAVSLRLLAGVHALVLAGRAPALARYYPSAGGTAGPDDPGLWDAFRAVLAEQADAVRDWLGHPPQTNEVGRAAALAGGLCHVAAEAPLPIRLVEIGASAGLNLRADRFRIDGRVASRGPASSALVLTDAWLGSPPPDVDVDVVYRAGIDLAPIDPVVAAGGLRLQAFVWPDQRDRLERLRGALEVARAFPADLRRADAVDAVRELTVVEGTWTVLWHSVFRQYLDDTAYADLERAIGELGATATPAARFAHLMLEPEPSSTADAFPVVLTTWPGGQRRVLGTAPAHGLPVTWSAP
jgi:hypothetical protein